ncbi:MAG: tRNA (adenosine(37)-N6)-threonylcarbamoyltransferase complex dimerization subunit type 1 TsaB [Gemmatimonadetes bacterium]|nr:tRNA (adenosine(37)-N6)-threonylcarbamoyltransferase complex dimerization subunit type 1 TsaB [Gemmatimonadota bacterium]
MTPAPYLAFDTSGALGSVAVGFGDEVLASGALEVRQEHASRLVPMIDQALSEAGVRPADLAGILVGEGPGSFTGVRVAAATAKGLAHALGLPLWAHPSLAAAALAEDAGPVRYVLFDARADRVYGACYRVGAMSVEEVASPHGGTLGEVLRGELAAQAVFVGDGARRHRGAIEQAGFRLGPGPTRSLAEGLLRLRALVGEVSPVNVSTWEPRYVRPSSAEPAWTP